MSHSRKDVESLSSETFYLAEEVRLREESWGGILFRQDNGTVVDVDRDAFALLTYLGHKNSAKIEDLLIAFSGKGKKNQSTDSNLDETAAVLQQFLDLGIIKARQIDASTETINGNIVEEPLLKSDDLRQSSTVFRLGNEAYALSAPETVHWAVTFNCEQACPDCYAGRYRKRDILELDTADALLVVETLARLGVFQLALGGGEPLLRSDLPIIARSAKEVGLAVHVTTGLIENLDLNLIENLAPFIKSLHIGVKQDRLLNRPQEEMNYLRQIVQAAQALGLRVGANLILCNTTLKHFGQVVDALINSGFKRIILLRYKPPFDLSRWLEKKPSPKAYLDLEAALRKTMKLYPHIELRLDCALSFLQRNLSPSEALAAGIRGCVAGNRVMAIDPNGNVYPCSQLMYPRFKAGNIFNDDFSSLWSAKPMSRYRLFREKRKFKETKCGACQAGGHCGGCRVFAHDALGSDPGCESPLFPAVCNLGREGRQAVLQSYIDRHFSISVVEYMEYFHVGQKKACKELKNISWLMPENRVSHGRKKTDTYIRADAYLLEDIQDLIGHTSGGAPFASLEEIDEWVNGPDLLDYPEWLLSL